MEERKIRIAAYIVALIIGGGALLFLFFKHLFLVVLPFLLAWALAFAVRPIAESIGKKIKIPKRVLRAILAVLISLTVIGIVGLLVWAISAELWRLLSGLGSGNALRELVDRITSAGIINKFFDTFGDRLGDVFYELLISVATALGKAITSWVGAVPKILLFILITVIASVYFALDLEGVNLAVSRIAPPSVYRFLKGIKNGAFSVGVRYLRSYLILMLMTFVIMLVGLLVLGRPYALLLAFVISALDVLPVIGVGTVLIPWGLYELAFGEVSVGIGLIILFFAYELIRQLAEPKIIGKHLGIHPLLSLLMLYVGYSLFGIVGILFVPAAVVLINVTLSKNDTAEVEEGTVTERDEG